MVSEAGGVIGGELKAALINPKIGRELKEEAFSESEVR